MPLMIKLNRNVVRVYLCLDNGHFIIGSFNLSSLIKAIFDNSFGVKFLLCKASVNLFFISSVDFIKIAPHKY